MNDRLTPQTTYFITDSTIQISLIVRFPEVSPQFGRPCFYLLKVLKELVVEGDGVAVRVWTNLTILAGVGGSTSVEHLFSNICTDSTIRKAVATCMYVYVRIIMQLL